MASESRDGLPIAKVTKPQRLCRIRGILTDAQDYITPDIMLSVIVTTTYEACRG